MKAKNLLSFTYKGQPRLIVEVESPKEHLRHGVDLFRFIDGQQNCWRSFKKEEIRSLTWSPLNCEVEEFLDLYRVAQNTLDEIEEWESDGIKGNLDLDTI